MNFCVKTIRVFLYSGDVTEKAIVQMDLMRKIAVSMTYLTSKTVLIRKTGLLVVALVCSSALSPSHTAFYNKHIFLILTRHYFNISTLLHYVECRNIGIDNKVFPFPCLRKSMKNGLTVDRGTTWRRGALRVLPFFYKPCFPFL